MPRDGLVDFNVNVLKGYLHYQSGEQKCSTTVHGRLPPLAAPPPRALVGIMGNEPHQSSGLFDFREYQLAIVEFDDQGRCYLRLQMKEVADLCTVGSTMLEVMTAIWRAFNAYYMILLSTKKPNTPKTVVLHAPYWACLLDGAECRCTTVTACLKI
jgi:hypothetical protein